jgi:predicted nucleic acid-binding protein
MRNSARAHETTLTELIAAYLQRIPSESEILNQAPAITTLFYLIARDKSPEQARVTLTSILQFLKIAPVNQNTIEQALNLPFRDFEDAVRVMAALQVHADYLLTRNVRDYQPAPMEVVQPVELLAIIKT